MATLPRHSRAEIFVCPERVFKIENGVILDQEFPVDYWVDGKCSCCGRPQNEFPLEDYYKDRPVKHDK